MDIDRRRAGRGARRHTKGAVSLRVPVPSRHSGQGFTVEALVALRRTVEGYHKLRLNQPGRGGVSSGLLFARCLATSLAACAGVVGVGPWIGGSLFASIQPDLKIDQRRGGIAQGRKQASNRLDFMLG